MRVAILLAAGSSRRFGRGDKLLARLRGRRLIDRAIDTALAAGTRRLIVVTAGSGSKVGRAVAVRSVPRIRQVRAARHREGLSASLAAGLAAVRPIERELVVFLADMPHATMPRAMRLRPGLDAVRPWVERAPGHPLLVRTAAARQSGADGDRGLAAVLDRVGRIAGHPGNLLDIDTRKALRWARYGSSHRRRR